MSALASDPLVYLLLAQLALWLFLIFGLILTLP